MSGIIKTDLLVVGGSLAGMAAAITAKENHPELNVTIVEKYTAGYAGKANRGAGILVTLGNSKPEDFVKYHTTYIGDNLNKQDALLKFAANMNDGLKDLDRWSSGKVCKNKDGSFRTLKWLAQITGVAKLCLPWGVLAPPSQYRLECFSKFCKMEQQGRTFQGSELRL